jgi:enediyne biosynthesis protein E4
MGTEKKTNLLSRSAAAIVGLIVMAVLFVLVQPPRLEPAERQSLADKFNFTRFTLAEPTGTPLQKVRQVHPSLRHIDAWISATGAGIALCDMDGDGLSNDYVQTEPRTNQVRIGPVPGTGNRYPLFDLNLSSVRYDPLRMAPMGTICGDFNEDGLTDVVVYFWGRTPVAFLQTSSAAPSSSSFAVQELVDGSEVWNTSSGLIADLDADGHLDLLFGNYFQDGAPVLDPTASGRLNLQDTTSRSYNGGKKHILLWRSASSGKQSRVTYSHEQSVFAPHVNGGWVIAMGSADLDGDLKPEIYFAHDVGPDRLMHNDSVPGKPAFSEISGRRDWFTPSSFSLGRDSYKGMGVDFSDINFDGVADIYVSNIACPFGLEESHFLWLSDGTRGNAEKSIAYVQASESLGLSRSGWAWDCRLADFNNDSVPEAIQAMGFIKGKTNKWPELQSLGTTNSTMLTDPANWPSIRPGDDVSGNDPNCFFVRSNSGRYFDIAKQLGIDDRMLGRGIAIADVDADGDLDFAIANQWGPSLFYRNDSLKTGRSLVLKLLKPASVPAVGAKAVVHLADGRLLAAEVDGGSGHTGKRAQELHFGLGSVPGDKPIQVDVHWLSTSGPQSRSFNLIPGRHTLELPG